MCEFPNLAARGFHICSDDPDAPRGITADEINRVLTTDEWSEFVGHLENVTVGTNGFYASDVEAFLKSSKGGA
jgi:hypothetical protein